MLLRKMGKNGDAVKVFAKRMMSGYFRAVWLIPFIIMIGCATQGHSDSSDDDNARQKARYERFLSTELSAAKGNIQIKAYPILDDELAKYLVGVITAESGMLATYVVVTNDNDYPVKIDLSRAVLDTAGGRAPALSTEAAIRRAVKSDTGSVAVSWLFFGVAGALIAGTNLTNGNITIEEHYWKNGFKPTLINGKSSAKGYLFFDVPEKSADRRNDTYTISVTDLAKNEIIEISLSAAKEDRTTPPDESK